MPFQAIAVLSGNRQKTIPNRSEEQLLSEVVLPFVANGIITAKWGKKKQSYQVLELRVFETTTAWDKRTGPLGDLLKRKRNQFRRLRLVRKPFSGRIVRACLSSCRFRARSTDPRRISASTASTMNDSRRSSPHPLEDLVGRIKKEIRDAAFVVADLTDERQSCYFEAGYAEALPRPILYVASKQSVLKPGTATKIHFDIHLNVQFFTNHKELKDKLAEAITKNRKRLFNESVEV